MNIIKVMKQFEEFIVGKKNQETLLDKKRKTVGFVADGIKPKRKYTRRKKTNAKKTTRSK